MRQRRGVEVEDLQLVLHGADLHWAGLHWADLHWADLHAADPRDNADRGPGDVLAGERLDALGGDGTPGVQELSLCELGIARGVHTLAARAVTADALDLRHRLGLTWAVVEDLRGEVWLARKVAAMTRRLSAEAVRLVDAVVAAAIGGQSPARVLEVAQPRSSRPTPPHTRPASRPNADAASWV